MDKVCRHGRAELLETCAAWAMVRLDYARVSRTHYSARAIGDIRQHLADRGVHVRPTGRAS